MKLQIILAATALGALVAGSAQAGVVSVSNGGASATITATPATGGAAPFALTNLGNAGTNGLVSTAPVALAGGGTITFAPNTSAPVSGVYDGNVPNVASSPYTGTGLAQGNYLVAEPGNSVTITPAAPRSTVNLLWGSVDTFNSLTLSFLSGSTVVGSIVVTGSNVASAAGISANGLTSAFVSILAGGTIPNYSSIVATSTTSAFEFDIGTTAVPEPASLALLGMGLAGLGMIRRRNA